MPQLDFLMYSNTLFSFIYLNLVMLILFFIYSYFFFIVLSTYYFFINSKFNLDNFTSYLYLIFNVGTVTKMTKDEFIEILKTTSLWSEVKSPDAPYWGDPIIKTMVEGSPSSGLKSVE